MACQASVAPVNLLEIELTPAESVIVHWLRQEPLGMPVAKHPIGPDKIKRNRGARSNKPVSVACLPEEISAAFSNAYSRATSSLASRSCRGS